MRVLLMGLAVALAVACGGSGEGRVPQNQPACLLGLTEPVQKTCACGAAQREVEVALAQTRLNDLARTSVLTCLNGDLSIGVFDKSLINGKVDGCLRKVQELDPAVRDEAIAIVTTAVTRSSSDSVLATQKVWNECYARLMAPPVPSETLAMKNAAADVQIRSSMNPVTPPQERGGKKIYDWHIWTEGVAAMLPDLKEVYYSFDHPSFDGNIARSSDSESSFRIRYRGWGCVEKMTATLVFKDDSRLAKTFSQCDVMPEGTPTKGGGTSGSAEGPAANAPAYAPRKCAPGEKPPPPETQMAPPCVP